MRKVITTLKTLRKKSSGYWSERIMSQLEYACQLSKVNDGKFDDLITKTVEYLDESFRNEETVTKDAAQKAESMIIEMSKAAKSFKMICTAHAHIDMNWMWGFAETVAVTLDTFRTMLDLMNEYPQFTFSQSQASVYRIVEEYNPEMLEEIRKRVKEGRWEVTASTWVETDKNMPNGESLSRHILYTRRYLSKLLDIDPDSLQIDFEPDTFGHNRNVPEILAKGGVRYYYHCRGYEGHNIYRWEAPSGSSVLAYREPMWYNSDISPSMVMYVPEFCTKHGMDTMLKVYGVGDHGGGPTRKDIEKIIEMSGWPVFPEIRFGSFIEYFSLLEKVSDALPVVKGELNFVFTGCYTTQTRIKMSNRVSEAKLNEAEAFSALSALFAGGRYRSGSFEEAWKKVLFNHFHDILPGSGVIDTREYAMGQFQQVLAAANTETSIALRSIAAEIDTSALLPAEEDIRETISEGAGVGYAVDSFGLPQAERGRGKTRVLHFFNPSAHERREPAEITVWDWEGDKDRIYITDAYGNESKYQILENETLHFQRDQYWGHTYMKLLVDVKVPSYGYATYILTEKEMDDIPVHLPPYPRVEKTGSYILENEYIKVVFDSGNASIISMIDKADGRELVNPSRPAGIFRLIEEDDSRGMTAWIIGRYMNVYDLNRDVKIDKVNVEKSSLRQWISYQIQFRNSKLNVTVSLDYNSPRLNYAVECDWQETAKVGKYIPQLNFHMPLDYRCECYKYDIPFGVIEREGMHMDVPANSWMAGIPSGNGKAVMLVTGTKYGFRGVDDSMAVTLIRSSYDPDPYPDNGIHKFGFAVEMVDVTSNEAFIKRAFDYNHPVRFISGTAHKGNLAPVKSFMSLESGKVSIAALKISEEGNADKRLILRVYEAEGEKTRVVIRFPLEISKAYYVDLNENPVDSGGCILTDGEKVAFDAEPHGVTSICIEI